MFNRSVAITVAEGCGSGCESRFDGAFRVGPSWTDDVTLLDMEESSASAVFRVQGFLKPKIFLTEGDNVSVEGVSLEPDLPIDLSHSPCRLQIGASELDVKLCPLISLSGLRDRLGRFFRSGRRSMVLCSACLAFGALLIVGSLIPAGGDTRAHAATPVLMGPKLNFWAEVMEGRSALLKLDPSVMHRQLSIAGLPESVIVAQDEGNNAYILSGSIPKSQVLALRNFQSWYAQTGTSIPLFDQVEIVDDATISYPTIAMVMGQAGHARVLFEDGSAASIGEVGQGGWLYTAYDAGVVTLEKNGEVIRLRAFRKPGA